MLKSLILREVISFKEKTLLRLAIVFVQIVKKSVKFFDTKQAFYGLCRLPQTSTERCLSGHKYNVFVYN